VTEGGSAGDDQIGPIGRDPLCPRVKPGAGFRHLPRKGEKGSFSKLSFTRRHAQNGK